MRFAKLFLFLLVLVACNKDKTSSDVTVPNGPSLPALTGDNVMQLTIDGSTCGGNAAYPNKPCVSIQVCSPGGSPCQTVNDILLDTGSTGLRIFKSVLTTAVPTALTVGANQIAECAQFGDGTSDWGPVMTASLILASQPAVNVPIHVIDSTYVGKAANCPNSDVGPASAGFNGILGLGLFRQDCGASCVTGTASHLYYTCTATTCTASAVPLDKQTANPVPLLASNNNGIIVELPAIPVGGVSNASGYIVLGIGTQANNTLTGTQTYGTDAIGQYSTIFNGSTIPGFTDTGSNGIFFPGTLTGCTGSYAGLFCPASTTNLSVTTKGTSGTPSGNVAFSVGNFGALVATKTNTTFVELGGKSVGYFDLGLPFFMGRNVAVGIETLTSPLGTGPYWAY